MTPNWEDLEDTIIYLRENQEIAEGIATRQRELMVRQGYMSEGAEACYWRRLVTAWGEMAGTVDSSDGWEDGVRWETVSLVGIVE